MNFQDKYNIASKKNKFLLCIGLDPDSAKIPKEVPQKDQFFHFSKGVVDATHDLVCAYKPNSAFFESLGSSGIDQLHRLTWYIKEKHPEIPIILDAKRADIGNTNSGYAEFVFDYLGCDGITLHPYLGREALEPFLSRKDKGCIVLCRTSNSGAVEFQDLMVNNIPLYQQVANNVVKSWNKNGNCSLVVGATYPTELKKVRNIVGDMLLLIPGIGAQGGDLEKTIKNGIYRKDNPQIMINVSRSVIYAGTSSDWEEKVRKKAVELKQEIIKYI
ncbi:orotidine-5'-phosphate decarboxylase [Patescibacteria group bacterium]